MSTDSPGPSASQVVTDPSATSSLAIITEAARGNEITGLDIFQKTTTEADVTPARAEELLAQMYADKPTGGTDLAFGDADAHRLRFWKSSSPHAPMILFVHGGSWRSGTYIDSIGSAKVGHLVDQGYAFATVNYTLFPIVTVKEQVQEVADSLAYLVRNATRLGFDPSRVILMGHSSGAHVATLLGTDSSYLERAGISIDIVRAVISIDGSNYNAMAELADSPGPVAENMISGLGKDPEQLQAMSPTYHARAPNAGAFLLLHVLRKGDIRQAVEFAAALKAAGTETMLHVFEGQSFEGHMQMLFRLGDPNYPATAVMDEWLKMHVPVSS